MAYLNVEKLQKEVITCSYNYYYSGAVGVKVLEENEEVYLTFDDKYFKFSKDGFESGNHLKKVLFPYREMPKFGAAKIYGYKLKVNGKWAFYVTMNHFTTKEPLMIFQEIPLFDEDESPSTINFVYKPKQVEGRRLYKGEIGEASEDLYQTAYNKSRLYEKAIPVKKYDVAAKSLLKKVEKCQYLDLAYSPKHEEYAKYIPNVFPQEMNKIYFISKLKYIIANYSSTKIYYSKSFVELERKYKAVLKFMKAVER